MALDFSTSFFDRSKARSTANPKLALPAQTLDLRPSGSTKGLGPEKI
jgi:hypothetical protein